MAWETGTASNHVDLLTKVRDFLKTNTTLVTASENWTQVDGPTGALTAADEVTLYGPGSSGTDEIYCSLFLEEDVSDDEYRLRIRAFSNYVSGQAPDNQPFAASGTKAILIWNQPMTYWIVGNGRRFILIVKVSTVYMSMYFGFGLPLALPSEYPYPCFLAGVTNQNYRWSSTSADARFFINPAPGAAEVFYPDNEWRNCQNVSNSGGYSIGDAFIFPVVGIASSASIIFNSGEEVHDFFKKYEKTFDDDYLLTPIEVHSTNPHQSVLMTLEGVYMISGRSNSSENIVTINSEDYLVVQDIFRTAFDSYMAIKLA